MRRASDDALKQRTVLKALKVSPRKGLAKADGDVLSQRKIVRAKRSSFGSPQANKDTPRESPTPTRTSPTPPEQEEEFLDMRAKLDDVLSQRKTVWAEQRSSFGSPQANKGTSRGCPTPTRTSTTPSEQDVEFLEMRARLFRKGDSTNEPTWVMAAAGTLNSCRATCEPCHRSIKMLHGETGSVVFKLDTGELKGLARIVKDSKKGRAAYLRFSAVIYRDHGEQSFLLQVKPEMLDRLYATLS